MAFLPAFGLSQNPIRSIERGCRVQVLVRDNNVDQALKALKKKMQREGIFREMKLRGHYEKPSEKKAREKDVPENARTRAPRPNARAKEAAARRLPADEAEAGVRRRSRWRAWRG